VDGGFAEAEDTGRGSGVDGSADELGEGDTVLVGDEADEVEKLNGEVVTAVPVVVVVAMGLKMVLVLLHAGTLMNELYGPRQGS